jgi:hypothetical protein
MMIFFPTARKSQVVAKIGNTEPMSRTAQAALAASAALLLVTAAAAATRPTLRVVRSVPLTLQAAGFRAGEAVTVSVLMDGTHLTRRLVAGPAGTASVRFSVRLRYCATPLELSARGARSGVAYAQLAPRECASP